MHDAFPQPDRAWSRFLAAALLSVSCAVGACASTNWERGVYEGLRRSPNTGERAGNPAPAADAALPDHARYEQERQRLRAAPSRPDAAPRPASAPAAAP